MRLASTLWLAAGFSGALAAGDPHFIDRANDVPVQQVYSGPWEHFVGGGVAVLDCNHSGFPSLYVAGGSGPSRLFVNSTAGPGQPITFTLGSVAKITDVTGAYPIDVDGDGWVDLFVLRLGGYVVLKGGADCTFTDVTKDWGLEPDGKWTTAFSATWEKGQSWPSIAIGNYVDRKNPDGPFFACDTNYLVRPRGRRFGPSIPLRPGFCALSMLISDWRRDGERTLRIANDRQYYVRDGYEQMWHLDPLREFTAAEGWPHVSLWGMGIASGDLFGTGYPDILTTSMGDQLLQLNKKGTLVAAPFSIGTYSQRPYKGDDGRPSTGWHAEFADVDNDGRMDLFIAKGNVDQMMTNASKDPNNLLIQQPDGTFVEKADAAGVGTTERSRGAALVDLNSDGLLDLVVVNRRAPMEVWQNDTVTANHWLEVQPRIDAGGNAYAVGAWVEVRAGGRVQDQEITVGGGHVSGHLTPLHFGLGPADPAEVRVTWPDGTRSDWTPVPVDGKWSLRGDAAKLTVGPLY
jgi:enediyne biosynthesis protein E4